MEEKKLFRLDLTIAIEAMDKDEAYEILTKDETIKQIESIIRNSQSTIEEFLKTDNEDNTIIIN